MKKRITLLTLLISNLSFANTYLSSEQIPNGLYILPPPPKEKSAAFNADKSVYVRPEIASKKSDWNEAIEITDLNNIDELFSDVVGFKITEENTPKTVELLRSVVALINSQVVKNTKQYYNRQRPFVYFNTHSCTPEKENSLKKNGDYPSGHSATGWALALILSEIYPERKEEILKRGYKIGEYGIICGVHWKSSVDAGRLLGSSIVSALHSSREFNQDLEKSRNEIRKKISENSWINTVYAPTYMVNIDNKWFLVDCWHSRILWNDKLDENLSNWKIMENKFSSHTLAYDGKKYWATEDTEHGRIVFYTFDGKDFKEFSSIDNLGRRTHRTIFDKERNQFMLLSATTGYFWRISIKDNKAKIDSHVKLPYSHPANDNHFEIRSFTIHDGLIYFVSSKSTPEILVTKNNKELTEVKRIPVSQDFQNMQEIYFFPDGKVFISSDYKKVAILEKIEGIKSAKNMYDAFEFVASPYFISAYKNNYIIPEIGYKTEENNSYGLNGVGLWQYKNGKIKKIKELIKFTSENIENKNKKSEIKFQVY
ncbi:phosphatase PAP2 family protein [Candidatus Sodalis sp. SoCistrobi]|uniref:acid phosphatase n=1 Tax=Candidatus Sodalis sp. SoCistrobi TaxID=1922216 RepID=UPI000939A118|nr:phosphatase PAP2 family protein [Candidatus Sodalis sp. SoCistrobi]